MLLSVLHGAMGMSIILLLIVTVLGIMTYMMKNGAEKWMLTVGKVVVGIMAVMFVAAGAIGVLHHKSGGHGGQYEHCAQGNCDTGQCYETGSCDYSKCDKSDKCVKSDKCDKGDKCGGSSACSSSGGGSCDASKCDKGDKEVDVEVIIEDFVEKVEE